MSLTDNEIITIDEAIRHCYEVYHERDDMCKGCRDEHLQLAKWLEELKESREIINRQKVAIDICKQEYNDMFEIAKKQKAEIEFLRASEGLDKAEFNELKAEIELKKAEIERLKNAYKQCAWERDIFAEDMGRYDPYTDSFAKEMVGD